MIIASVFIQTRKASKTWTYQSDGDLLSDQKIDFRMSMCSEKREEELFRQMSNALDACSFVGEENALVRRKIAIFCNSLDQLKVAEGRLNDLSIKFREKAIGETILEFEQDLIKADSRDVSWSVVLAQIALAESNGCLRSICWHLMNDSHIYVPVIQEAGLLALKRMCTACERKKDELTNCGGISMLVSCLQNHSRVPSVQRLATGLLMSLVSFCHRKTDWSVIHLLLEANALQAIAEAAELNFYKIDFCLCDDEDGNYERALACRQVPVVCRFIMHSFSNGGKKQRDVISKRFAFLQTCTASLLNDDSITKDLLRSILLAHY